MTTKSLLLLAALLLTNHALFAAGGDIELQLTGLKVEMVWNDPYQPTALDYQLRVDFSLAPNSTIDPLKDNVTLGTIFPHDPWIIFSIPAGAFSATDKGFEVRDPKALGVTIQRRTPGPNNEPPKLIDDLSDLWSDVRIRLRASDGVHWQFGISAGFAANARVLPVTRVPSLVYLSIGSEAGLMNPDRTIGNKAGVMNPGQIVFQSPRDVASLVAKGDVALSDTELRHDLGLNFTLAANSFNRLKESVNVVVEIPNNPCVVVSIPAGAFTTANNGFVVKDPKAAGMTIQLVAPGDPSTGTPPKLVEDSTGRGTDLRIRLRSKDGVNWHLQIGVELPRACDFQGGCNVLALFNAAEQVNLAAGDDKLSARIGKVEHAD